MKNFLVRILCFLSPILIASGIILAASIGLNFILENEVLSNSLENKILALTNVVRDPDVIIAGDSRAERQLMPSVIEKRANLNVINIAESVQDIVTVVSAIKKYHLDRKGRIFIVSASSWQINDGAIIEGYLSDKCFQQLSIKDRIVLYRNELGNLRLLQERLLLALLKKMFHAKYNIGIVG